MCRLYLSMMDKVNVRPNRFGDATEPGLRAQVAKALWNMGNRLGVLNRSADAIVAYDEVVRRFGDRGQPKPEPSAAKEGVPLEGSSVPDP